MRNTTPTLQRHPRLMRRRRAQSGFTLVELLTVVFIIGALIAILVPSISAARNQAKTVATKSAIKAIEVGLLMFKSDNAKDFPQTNGFPPSFSHPVMIGSNFAARNSVDGQFPFIPGRPTVSGAHWLPAMLMGVDQQGYISRKTVPKADRAKVEKWYTADGASTVVLERSNLYLDPGNVRTVRTENIRGRGNTALYDESNEHLQKLPVIVDMFDQPLLYYVANTHGRGTNMVEGERVQGNSYTGTTSQSQGPAYYFHQDNVMFTGDLEKAEAGWSFGGSVSWHPIANSGKELTAPELKKQNHSEPDSNHTSFATYICDRKLLKSFTRQSSDKTRLRPVNQDSFLLISAGVDGRYGTVDDPKNFPGFEE